jgi:diaminohydroxyphosphoribosylaminopyrimidine deaminase/5-amino-6-(5-phosphoribosylamino)uracil reductase
LIQAKVGRVIIASQDPHHHAKGGADRLRAAGIPVLIGVCHSDAYELNRGFFEAHLHGKPWVRCKLAISIDGRTALKSGESQWITGSESRASVQTLRALSGALITGIGTVLRDDPRLSIRGIPAAPSVRVILDRDFRMPMDAALLKEPGSVWWAGANTLGIEPAPELVQRCERIIRAPSDHLLAQTLSALYQAQIWDVCIEAGPTLAGAFFSAGWIDEIWCYMAPCWLGAEGAPMFHIPSPATMAEKISWHTHSVEKIGEDILWILRK